MGHSHSIRENPTPVAGIALLAAAVGAITAMLITPKRGDELRRGIGEKIGKSKEDVVNKMQNKKDDVTNKMSEATGSIKSKVDDVADKSKDTIDKAKDKADR